MIKVNVDKAKNIAHDKRRGKRDELFQPHDEVIAKQIPGKSANEAEAARQAIRDQDAVVQGQIDSATTVDELKNALAAYGAV